MRDSRACLRLHGLVYHAPSLRNDTAHAAGAGRGGRKQALPNLAAVTWPR